MAGKTQVKDMTGQTFGSLTVIGRDGTYRNTKQAAWLCQCRCGKQTRVCGNVLRRGLSKTCGCSHGGRVTHGKSGSPTWYAWVGMRQRCQNPNSPAYKHYGGRGIAVCERWQVFENFLEDMGERPMRLTLDRINNDGIYEPGNCRWATWSQQALNQRRRRTMKFDTAKGSMNIAEIAAEAGIHWQSAAYRVRSGYSPEELVKPKHSVRRCTTS